MRFFKKKSIISENNQTESKFLHIIIFLRYFLIFWSHLLMYQLIGIALNVKKTKFIQYLLSNLIKYKKKHYLLFITNKYFFTLFLK